MSRLDLGSSPNTLALLAGLGVLTLACTCRPRSGLSARTVLGWGAFCLCAAVFAGTQSRAACLGLLMVAGIWLGLYSKRALLVAGPLIAAALLLLVWLALAGRASPASLHTGASIRQWIHTAAVMQAGEAFFSTPARVGGLAEDAAMRFGFPLGLEQGRMIKGPLSTLLAWLDPLLWPMGLFGFIGLVAPACIWPPCGVDKSSPSGLALWVPSAAVFTLVCAAFNCLHQDRLGRWLLPLLAFAGWVWLAVLIWRRRPAAVALGLAGAVAAGAGLLVGGWVLLRQNCLRRGADVWQSTRFEAGANAGDETLVVAATSKPRGTVILFDHAPDTVASWTARRALFRRAAERGWKLVLIPGIGAEAAGLERIDLPAPLVVAGLAGPAPEKIVRMLAPAKLVQIDGGLVVWLTSDGASPTTERHWVATHPRSEAELARGLDLVNMKAGDTLWPQRIAGADYDEWKAFWNGIVPSSGPDNPSLL